MVGEALDQVVQVRLWVEPFSHHVNLSVPSRRDIVDMPALPDTDCSLITAVIADDPADDPAGVEHFVRRYTRLGNHDADDFTQRVFVKLFQDD